MFETADLEPKGRTGRASTLAMSTALQVAVAAAALLYPLVHIEPLPRAELRSAHLRHRPVVELVPVAAAPARSPTSAVAVPTRAPHVWTPPRVVPAGIPSLFDEAPPDIQTTAAAGAYPGPSTPCVGACAPSVDAPKPLPPAQPRQPAAATAAPRGPVAVGGDVKAPQLVSAVQPAYPPLARQARIQGAVRVQAVITREGVVRSLRLVSGHPLLAQAALDAVRQWRYEATRLNGVPVEVVLQVDVNFTLAR